MNDSLPLALVHRTEPQSRGEGSDATNKKRWALYLARRYVGWTLRSRFDGFFVEGLEEARHVAAERPVIFAASHVSRWDAFALVAADEALGTDGYVLMDERSLARLPFFSCARGASAERCGWQERPEPTSSGCNTSSRTGKGVVGIPARPSAGGSPATPWFQAWFGVDRSSVSKGRRGRDSRGALLPLAKRSLSGDCHVFRRGRRPWKRDYRPTGGSPRGAGGRDASQGRFACRRGRGSMQHPSSKRSIPEGGGGNWSQGLGGVHDSVNRFTVGVPGE